MTATPVVRVTAGAELPDQTLTWRDDTGTLINFSSGYTFTLKIGTTPVTSKTTGIVGAATDPNISIAWSTGELDAITPAVYEAQLWARRTSDSKDRIMPLRLVVHRGL